MPNGDLYYNLEKAADHIPIRWYVAKLLFAFFFCCLFCAIGCEAEPTVIIKRELLVKHRKIAVLPFTDAPGADAGYSGQVVANIIGSFALNVPGWTIVEREKISRILDEQDFQRTGLVDPKTAIKIGKLLGADGVVLGGVAQYRIGSIPFLFMFTFDQDVYKVDYSFRLVSVQTGEICISAHASRSSTTSFEQSISDGASKIFQRITTSLTPPRSTVSK